MGFYEGRNITGYTLRQLNILALKYVGVLILIAIITAIILMVANGDIDINHFKNWRKKK